MELLDRYLTFIRFWLPRGKQQDIIAELSEDLHAQIADQEAGLGRALNEAELEAVLKRCGHPLLVAARYQAQQQLIGQPLYPLYLFALKMVLWVLFPLLLVLGAIIAVFRAHPIGALIGSVGDAVAGAIYMVGIITLVCVVLERLQIKLDFLDDWRPRDLPKLPVVPDPIQIPRSESFGSFVGLLVFTLWWVDALAIPPIPHVHFLQPLPQSFLLAGAGGGGRRDGSARQSICSCPGGRGGVQRLRLVLDLAMLRLARGHVAQLALVRAADRPAGAGWPGQARARGCRAHRPDREPVVARLPRRRRVELRLARRAGHAAHPGQATPADPAAVHVHSLNPFRRERGAAAPTRRG